MVRVLGTVVAAFGLGVGMLTLVQDSLGALAEPVAMGMVGAGLVASSQVFTRLGSLLGAPSSDRPPGRIGKAAV